jgi:hypothetical protein
MLKHYLSKFAMDILPSVAATIIGAYIVNHYIATKPAADVSAAAVSTAEPKTDAKADAKAMVVRAKADAKGVEATSDVASIPAPGIKAKGISEKAIREQSAAEKPQEPAAEKAEEKSADRPAETASIPVDVKRHPQAPREKTVAKAVPAPPSVPASVPVAAPIAPPAIEATSAPEEHRDANDLARAAIERLRGGNEGSPRPQEAARIPDPTRAPDAGRVADVPRAASAPAVRPLPPPIMVSTPSGEAFDSASAAMKPPYPSARNDDPSRPTPPADIPYSQPLDLRAEAAEPPVREHKTVAEDMLLAAKSVFHAVLPK